MQEIPSLDDARRDGYRAYQYTSEGIIVRRETSKHGVFETALVRYKPVAGGKGEP